MSFLKTLFLPMSEERKSQQEGTYFQETYRIGGSSIIGVSTAMLFFGILSNFAPFSDRDHKTPHIEFYFATIAPRIFGFLSYLLFTPSMLYVSGSVGRSFEGEHNPWRFEDAARKLTYGAVFLFGTSLIYTGIVDFHSYITLW